jgi:predicted RNA-binding protein YlqC (UPF0109 family)
MRRPRIQKIRNKLDVTDRAQVRVVTRRLHLSEAELTEIIGRIGNSIAAINKEVMLHRAAKLSAPAQAPSAAVVAAATVVGEAAELTAPAERISSS